jgi:hypothetical protein
VSLVTVSQTRNRVYQRKFDHEEAQRRHKAGESVYALAREFGVSPKGVARVVFPAVRAQLRARTNAALRSGTCEDCGKQGIANQSRRCNPCAAIAASTTARSDTLLCRACQRWLPDNSFPHDRGGTSRRGRHRDCTACNTRQRRDYRQRNKVPCPGCGKPTSKPGTEGRRRQDGFCHACAVSQPKGEVMAAEPSFIVLVQEEEGLWREEARVAAKDKRDALGMAFNGEMPKGLVAVCSLQAFRPGRIVPVQTYDLEIAD